MEKIIITGATSMIGIAIIHAVMRESPGTKIYAAVREGSFHKARLPHDKRLSVIECSANHYGRLPDMIKEKCDVFYHIAWTATGRHRDDSVTEQERNIAYTLDALNAAYALGCRKFIGAGSQAEFGPQDAWKISPGTPVNPVTAYGVAKYAAGSLASMQAERLGMDCLWVRIFSVYGLFEKERTMIQSSIKKLKAGERPFFTAAEQRWDYLYSEDAGEAFYKIGEKATGRKVYCLGGGTARPLKEYIQIMGKMVNGDVPLGIGELPYPEHAVMNLCADISDLRGDTGWEPVTSFEEGIAKTLKLSGGGV